MIEMKNGVTLIEVLVVVGIVAIIGAAVFGLLSVGNISWHSSSTSHTVEQELRRGIVFMEQELKKTGPSVIVGVPADGVNYNSITFRIPEDLTTDNNDTILNDNGEIEWSANPITYQLVFNAQLNSYQLTRTKGGTTTVLANYLPTAQSIRFRRSQSEPNVLEINLQVQKSSSFEHITTRNISSRVFLRNP